MKVSVSLPEEDVEFLDGYASAHGVASRSAALQQAVALLRAHALADFYERAWSEWEAGGTHRSGMRWWPTDSMVPDEPGRGEVR